MGAYEIKREHVKRWVVNESAVNNPYKKSWTAAITIGGYDYYGEGNTIEAAYEDMTNQIMKSPYIVSHLKDIKSFIKIVKS